MSLNDLLDGAPFVGLAVTFVHTGYNASIEFEDGQWSPNEFGTSASDAIRKVFAKHGPVQSGAPAPLAPPSTSDVPAPVPLAPPPY